MADERLPTGMKSAGEPQVTEPDDAVLLAAIAQGDEPALRALYDRHKIWLARRLRARMPADAVEDVLQETFFAVWRGASRYQSSGDVAAWIWGIARRQAALWARNHGRHHLALEFLTAETPVASENTARTAITRVDVQQALAALGPAGSPMRDVAQQAFIEGRAIAEIARSLDVPEGTVKSRIFNLRKKLIAALGKEHAG
jgi:RNA polymerase sigma-70 factor (ECF subfamily)